MTDTPPLQPLSVECPRCGAVPNQICDLARFPHAERVDAAKAARANAKES